MPDETVPEEPASGGRAPAGVGTTAPHAEAARASRAGRPWYRPMVARPSRDEERSATPLELLFDLCFVVAVALAASRLHHAVSEDHVGDGVVAYLMVFFAIWWAWMNFTWFASAYDTDDPPYRLATLLQIAGVLVVAAGVPRAFDTKDFGVVTLGYAIMRLSLAGQWLRAAAADPAARRTARRYAAGVTLCLLGWAALTLFDLPQVLLPGFLVMVVAELTVPVWAERTGVTPWNPNHISERYGLFTLIVLGETVLAATTAVQVGVDAGEATGELLAIAASGLVVVFSMWWLYFERPAHRFLTSNRVSFVWGYGHYLIFASAAAVGAGIAVTVDQVTGKAHLADATAAGAVAVPVAVFLVSVWLLHVRPHRPGLTHHLAFPTAATGALLAAGTGVLPGLPLIALLLAGTVATCFTSTARGAAAPADPAGTGD